MMGTGLGDGLFQMGKDVVIADLARGEVVATKMSPLGPSSRLSFSLPNQERIVLSQVWK